VAVAADYVRLLFVPTGQALDHVFPIYTSILAPRVLLSAALHLLLAAVAVAPFVPRRGGAASPLDPATRIVSFGIAWFFLGLAPQSTFIPNPDLFMEHRLYLPSVGASLAIATALALALRRIPRVRTGRAIVLCGVALSILLATATMNRNEAWRSELSIWQDSAGKAPGTPRAHANLGTLLILSRSMEEGLDELRRAVELAPEWAWPRAQLGAALLQAGRLPEAEAQLRRALELRPDDPEACFNLAVLQVRTGRREEARASFTRFLELTPTGYDAARKAAMRFLASPP
jgi:tetratricopeptide (TPR) repeat protein